MSKSIVIFGMGRFGKAVANQLVELGQEVMVVDNNEDNINQIADRVTCAITADVLDPTALSNIVLDDMDVVVVAMAQDLEATIMCIMAAKDAGVPFVLAKARDERMGEVLKKIGADQIVYPEKETGIRVARRLTSSDFLDFFNLSENVCMVEMKPKTSWVGKNLKQLDLRKHFGINVVAIKDGDELSAVVDPDKKLTEDSVLVITINKKDLKKISS